SFGYQRVGILVALLNARLLGAIVVAIVIEALHRLQHPSAVRGGLMAAAAVLGLGISLLIARSLQPMERDLTVRSALMHIWGDAWASAGIIVAGLLIALTGRLAIDPLLSLGIAALIAWSAWRVLAAAIDILLESPPADLRTDALVAAGTPDLRRRDLPGEPPVDEPAHAAGLNEADRRRALFVVNPALPRTGPDFGRRLLELAGELGWEAMVLETAAGLNVESIGAALARRDFQLVLAAGGDGTVAEVMAAAHQRGLPIGIVPLGTANIVARELKLPSGWRAATRRALERFPSTRPVDLVRVNDGYSALAAGIGFDATVMRYTPRALKIWLGRAAYLLAGAWWLP